MDYQANLKKYRRLNFFGSEFALLTPFHVAGLIREIPELGMRCGFTMSVLLPSSNLEHHHKKTQNWSYSPYSRDPGIWSQFEMADVELIPWELDMSLFRFAWTKLDCITVTG